MDAHNVPSPVLGDITRVLLFPTMALQGGYTYGFSTVT